MRPTIDDDRLVEDPELRASEVAPELTLAGELLPVGAALDIGEPDPPQR